MTDLADRTVLLVDDDPALLHALARALRHEPYRLHTARSADEALGALKAHPVDVVVSDEQMPGMKGSELLGWIAESCPEVVRIVLTGHATAETAIRAINQGGAYYFFTKPCNTTQLAAIIRKAIEYKALIEENRRLVELNARQVRRLERMNHDLGIVTRIASEELAAVLDDIARQCDRLDQCGGDGPPEAQRDCIEAIRRNAAAGARLVARLADHAEAHRLGAADD